MNWISVKDKLPELNQRVLAYGIKYFLWNGEDIDDGFSIQLCPYKQYDTFDKRKHTIEWVYNDHCCVEALRDVTHWTPLPDEPKGE